MAVMVVKRDWKSVMYKRHTVLFFGLTDLFSAVEMLV